MSKQRKFILLAAVVGIISIFLPWLTVSVFGVTNSTNGFRSYGIVVFLAFLGAAGISLMGEQSTTLDQSKWLLVLAAGAIAFIFTLLFYTNINSALGMVGTGFGLWIAILASAGVIGAAWMYKNPADNLKSGFDSLKKSIPGNQTPPPDAHPPSGSNRIAELERLINLKNEGKISEEEYQQLKSKLL